MRTVRVLWLMIAMLAVALWIGACSDDDPAAPSGGDTTAPQVVNSDPSDGQVAVNIDETIIIFFSEAMDPATADGAITLSASAVTSTGWEDDRTLVVAHDDWEEGAQITVTVGTGLKDVAGNALAAAHSFSFWTETPGQVLLLGTTPIDGAEGVNRDAVIMLQFSQSVLISTIDDDVIITDNPPLKANYPFTAQEVETGLVMLTPDATLAENTELTVIVGADVGNPGASLGTTHTFSFTTGVEVDTDPPTIVSTDPANGNMSVAANQGFIRMTFSEPMDPDTVQPAQQSLAFYFMTESSPTQPTWSEGGTVLTVLLPTPLPTGLPMEATFVGFADLAGNAQETPYVWDVKVAGTTEYVPVVDESQFILQESWAEGEVGNSTPQDNGSWSYFQQMEVQPDDSFRMVDYDDPYFDPPGDWEAYRKTSGALQWLGFFEAPDAPAPPPAKEMFDAPLDILPLPIAVRTWTDNTTVTIFDGEEPMSVRAALLGRVISKADYPIYESEGEVFIKDAWTVVRELEVEVFTGMEWVTMFTQTDSIWYGPSQGDVRTVTSEVDVMDGRWSESETWRFPWSDGMFKSGQPATIEEIFPQH